MHRQKESVSEEIGGDTAYRVIARADPNPCVQREIGYFAVAILMLASSVSFSQTENRSNGLTFQIKIAADQVGMKPESGRVLVGIGPTDGEPNFTNYQPPVFPIFGADVESFTVGKTVTLNANSVLFPTGGLG